MKEENSALHVAKVEGILALVEEANVVLESLSPLVDVAKMNVYYLELMIRYKGEIPEKVTKSFQVDQLNKLLDADPFHPFSPHVQMKYYNN